MKKGFTLMELLAVIIVLGVISMITVNVVTNNIETTKKKTFEVNAIGLLEAAKEYVTKEMEDNDFPKEGIEAKKLNMKNNPFISGIVKRNEQDQIILENVTDGKYCANGVKSNLEITEGSCETEDETAPTLKLKELKTKRTSTQIMIKTQDNGSGINYYEYCINEECKKVEKKGKKEIIKEVITLNDLEINKEYVIKVKAVNGKELEELKEIKVKTKEIEEPTFKISSSTHATTKELIITYPSVEEGYVKGYELYKGETPDKKEVTGIEERLQITETMKVVAYIEKDNEIVISNSIVINGIDLESPKVNVAIPDIDSWTKTKIVTIEATDTGVGLALRPYSYDGGKTWVKENKKEYTTATQLDIKVRDRLGNISNEFTLNEGSCFENGKNLCYINKVDGTSPDIDIKVISGTKVQTSGYTDWYNSDEVKVRVTVTEYYTKDDKKTLGGVGIGNVNVTLKNEYSSINNSVLKNENLDKVQNKTYEFILNKSGQNVITVVAKDALGNSITKDMKIKIDNIIPVVSVKKSSLGLGTSDYSFVNNLNVIYGPTSGNASCNPSNSLKTGTYTVTCTAKGNNGKVANSGANVSFEAKHQVAGTGYSCKTGTRCKYKYSNCQGGFKPDTGGNTVSCNCGSRTDRVGNDNPSSYVGRCCEDEDVYGTCYSCPTGSSHSKCPSGTAVNICCY